jgi:hypothetical protein
VRKALETLPWVEKGTVKPDVDNQQVTFAVKDSKAYSYDEVKQAIESQTTFQVGKVLRGP